MTDVTRVDAMHTTMEHETLGDAQVRRLIEEYVRLSGSALTELGPHLYQLTVAAGDRAAFGGRSTIRLAFSVEAVQVDPEAEMAIVGGAFVDQLIEAIRARGTRHSAGRIGREEGVELVPPQLPLKVHRGAAGAPATKLVRHPIGRLTARVVIRAGTSLEEHLVDSAVVDLATGLALGADISAVCDAPAAVASDLAAVPLAPPRKPQELLKQMLSDLEVKLRPEIQRIREKSERELALEVARIDRYYQALIDDVGKRASEGEEEGEGEGEGDTPEKEARRVYEAERERRSDEERERHDVRAAVHPVQLTEWDVLVERADWPIESSDGHRGTFTAQRPLAGEQRWILGCPTCGVAAPDALAVCVRDHVACTTCARECTVCLSSFCTDHGIATCHVDDAPACDAHARTCRVCQRVHCTVHEGTCKDGEHAACTACLAPCAYCGAVICDRHAELSRADSPRGARRFCRDCAKKCEGGTGEIVGPDEVTQCASCDRVVCLNHQATCAVDGKVHCSRHLRRTDRSRRLVCEDDRAACAYEANAVFASDEVQPCPVCTKVACGQHRRECANCGRSVCTADMNPAKRDWCATCILLDVVEDPPDEIIAAANAIIDRPGRARQWKLARDATHTVAEMDFGWTRRTVFVLRHGAQKPERAMRRSAFGSRPVGIVE